MVIRISLATWTAAIFEESDMPLVHAALALSALEIGGFAGSTIGGWVSDTMFDGRRGPVMCIFRCVCVCVCVCVHVVVMVVVVVGMVVVVGVVAMTAMLEIPTNPRDMLMAGCSCREAASHPS